MPKPIDPADEIAALALARGGRVMGVNVPKGAAKGRPKRSKYGNQITRYNGVTYSSKAEAARAAKLDELVATGVIIGWARQVKFFLPDPETSYTVDFVTFGWDEVRAEEVKGRRTPKFNADVRRWRRHGPCPLIIITGGKVVERIEGKQRKAVAS